VRTFYGNPEARLITGPNTLGMFSTHSGYSYETGNMRGVLFGTVSGEGGMVRLAHNLHSEVVLRELAY
jgi:hypothetical protein